MDSFFVSDSITFVVDRTEGKIWCADMFLVLEEFTDH